MRCQLLERVDRDLHPLACAVEPGRPADRAEADCVSIQRSRQRIAVGDEARLDLGSFVGEDGERGRVSELAFVGLQEFVNFASLIRHLLKRGVDAVYQQDHFDRLLGPGESAKRRDCLRSLVVENGEIFLLKTRDRWAGLARDADIQPDRLLRCCSIAVLGHRCRWLLRRNRRRQQQRSEQSRAKSR